MSRFSVMARSLLNWVPKFRWGAKRLRMNATWACFRGGNPEPRHRGHDACRKDFLVGWATWTQLPVEQSGTGQSTRRDAAWRHAVAGREQGA